MCGLMGFAGNPKALEDKQLALQALVKIKMLGLFNESRGRHSCGIYIDNTVFKGVNDEKEFSDFIIKKTLPPPSSENPIIIGHTRAATHGAHTYENAHPFMVGDDRFILAHNGQIKNIWTLCNKYDIKHSHITVDSRGLAELINKVGFKVLEEYDGYAALLMHKRDDPDSLYVYKGASKRTERGEAEEERPMFVLQQPEGCYFSSLAGSLYAIANENNTEKVYTLEENVVHKFTNGRMTKYKFPVNRKDVYFSYQAPAQKETAANFHTGCGAPVKDMFPPGTSGTNSHARNNELTMQKIAINAIWYETLPSRLERMSKEGADFVMYHESRYWRCLENSIELMHGTYFINKRGDIFQEKQKGKNTFYFFEGALMRDKKAYDDAKQDEVLKSNDFNIAMQLSIYSMYPITNTMKDAYTRCKSVAKFNVVRWYHFGVQCKTVSFGPKWSERDYTLRDGLTDGIVGKNDNKDEVCFNTVELKKARQAAWARHFNERQGLPDTTKTTVVLPPDSSKAPTPPSESKVFHQQGIPFREGIEIVNEMRKASEEAAKKKFDASEVDPINFHRHYETVQEARATLRFEEVNALRLYICDVMLLDMGHFADNIDDDNVDIQVNIFLQLTIENKQSLVEMWDTANFGDIYHYLGMSKNLKDMRYYDRYNKNKAKDKTERIEDKEEEVCHFIPKPVETIDSNLNKLEQMEKEVSEEYELTESPFIDGVSANPNDDKEEPVQDTFMKQLEAATIPKPNANDVADDEEEEDDFDDFDETEDEKQIRYIVQDAIDYLATIEEDADDLVGFDTDFSNEIANLTYKFLKPFKSEIKRICKKHGKDLCVEYMEEITTNIKEKARK